MVNFLGSLEKLALWFRDELFFTHNISHTKYVAFLHIDIQLTPLGVLQFNSIQFNSKDNYLELVQPPQVKGSVHKTALSSDTNN